MSDSREPLGARPMPAGRAEPLVVSHDARIDALDDVGAWVSALLERHGAALTRPELLKAIRALSVRYVEERASLPSRSPLDTAGKRAAFAAYYAPLHVLTLRAILLQLNPPRVRTLVDLGCGTGAAGIAWSLAGTAPPVITAVDVHPWALAEARWNLRFFGLRCTARRASLVDVATKSSEGRESLSRSAWAAAWSVNELPPPDRERLRAALIDLHARGACILLVEPLSRRSAPWWDDWAETFAARGGRADAWTIPLDLPAPLAELDRAAGFRRDHLSARSLWLSSPGE